MPTLKKKKKKIYIFKFTLWSNKWGQSFQKVVELLNIVYPGDFSWAEQLRDTTSTQDIYRQRLVKNTYKKLQVKLPYVFT